MPRPTHPLRGVSSVSAGHAPERYRFSCSPASSPKGKEKTHNRETHDSVKHLEPSSDSNRRDRYSPIVTPASVQHSSKTTNPTEPLCHHASLRLDLYCARLDGLLLNRQCLFVVAKVNFDKATASFFWSPPFWSPLALHSQSHDSFLLAIPQLDTHLIYFPSIKPTIHQQQTDQQTIHERSTIHTPEWTSLASGPSPGLTGSSA